MVCYMLKMKNNCIVLLVCLLMTACGEKHPVTLSNLRCELITDPIGIDCVTPRLSWEINSDHRGLYQTAYRILVASSLGQLNADQGDLWDSGQIQSGNSIFVPYSGKELKSRAECYWKVQIDTNHGKSGWSQPAKWMMGVMDLGEWQAKWIGLDKSFAWDDPQAKCTRLSARYFRKEFEISQQPVKAVLHISGLGLYKLRINGEMIGDQELSPTPTEYARVVKYNTFDVTKNFQKGHNAVAVVLGNGRFFHMRHRNVEIEYPKMILQLELEYADGHHQTIMSDHTWKVTADGPIRANNEYDGEEYDARKEMPGWDKSGFDDRHWLGAEYTRAPGGKLEAQNNQNIKVMDVVRPVAITEKKPGTYVLDMGQNMVGWLRMKVRGNKGDRIQLRFAENLDENGNVCLDNLRGGLATDQYTLKGEATETWEPSFTSHGFQYVEITGYPGTPSIHDFEGRVVYDEMETTGYFETSNKTINQIYSNAYWSIRGNYRGMPTDCPQRTERMGWLGDRTVGAHGESFVFNNNNLYAKWLDDIRIAQREDGSLPDIAPNYWNKYTDNMTWPGTFVTVTNMLYEQFGDLEQVVKNYDAMKKWLGYMRTNYMVDGIMPRDRYGDWCMPPELPTLNDPKDSTRITEAAVIGTTFYYQMLDLLEKFAGLIDKPDDVKLFAEQKIQVKESFNKKFLNTQNGQYSNNSVTANLLPLCFGMVPKELENLVFGNIVNRTMNDFNGHLSTGVIGCQWLMRGFSDYGRPDIAYQVVTAKDYPGWGYMVEKGATTIWEHWNGDAMERWIDSKNHVMLLGDLIVWFYEYLAGIQNTPGNCGFKQITMKPSIIDGLDEVKASYHSVHGLIKSAWMKTGQSFQWEITVPCNTTATVYIPATCKENITENGQTIPNRHIKFVGMDGDYTVCEIGSGIYSFLSVR